jgi:hypothetical protein
MPVPVEVQASLLPKILSFERMDGKWAPEKWVVGILFQSSVRSSIVCAQEFADAIPKVLRSRNGSPAECTMIEYTSDAELVRRMKDEGVTLLYVAPLRAVDIERVGGLLQTSRVLSYTGVPPYVDAGLALGIDLLANRPKIVVNLPVTRGVGMEFSSQLLKLARVIE